MYAGRYLVSVAAQTCIGLASHVIASEGWRAPRDFGDSFTVLREYGVIDDALAGRLRGLAGSRNRLVHVYDEIALNVLRLPGVGRSFFGVGR